MAGEFRSDWWSKTIAGAMLGFGLGVSLSGLLLYLVTSGDISSPAGHYAMLRYTTALVWILVFGFCFLFRSGVVAWCWLGAANVLAFAALLACRFWYFA